MLRARETRNLVGSWRDGRRSARICTIFSTAQISDCWGLRNELEDENMCLALIAMLNMAGSVKVGSSQGKQESVLLCVHRCCEDDLRWAKVRTAALGPTEMRIDWSS